MRTCEYVCVCVCACVCVWETHLFQWSVCWSASSDQAASIRLVRAPCVPNMASVCAQRVPGLPPVRAQYVPNMLYVCVLSTCPSCTQPVASVWLSCVWPLHAGQSLQSGCMCSVCALRTGCNLSGLSVLPNRCMWLACDVRALTVWAVRVRAIL